MKIDITDLLNDLKSTGSDSIKYKLEFRDPDGDYKLFVKLEKDNKQKNQ